MSKIEWTEYGKTFDEFEKADLNRPGVQVEVQDQDTYLLGHVNVSGGLCDDCPGINYKDIIARYRQLLSDEDLE